MITEEQDKHMSEFFMWIKGLFGRVPRAAPRVIPGELYQTAVCRKFRGSDSLKWTKGLESEKNSFS
uniref:Uncharacterized protein n=1 Tax=Arundo donax TaxID=35708 RepID=A0A0A9CI58_ARUDO